MIHPHEWEKYDLSERCMNCGLQLRNHYVIRNLGCICPTSLFFPRVSGSEGERSEVPAQQNGTPETRDGAAGTPKSI